MKTKELHQYRELSTEMRKLPGQLAAALGDAHPVGLQLFLCCNLGGTWKQPRDCADRVWDKMGLSKEGLSTVWRLCRSLEPPPLSDMAWAKFMVSNYDRLPKETASWEEWYRFRDRTGCYRYYGLGDKKATWDFHETLEKAGSLLEEYEKLNVPEELEWATPSVVRFDYDCSLHDYTCLLELVCREAGHCGDENLICVEEAGLKVLFEETVIDDSWGKPKEIKLGKLERVGLELFQVDDFCTAFAKAIEAWIPEDAENADYDCDPDEDVPSQKSSLIVAAPECQVKSEVPPEKDSETAVPPERQMIERLTVRSVTFGWGERSFWAMSDSGKQIAFGEWATSILDGFVRKVALKSPSEVVMLRELHDAICEVDPEPGSASDGLRKKICILQREFSLLGRLPEGVRWIVCRPKVGYYLNGSIKWDIDRETLGRRKSDSVWYHRKDARKMAEDTVDKDHKLPARPYRPKNDREDDDE